MNSENKGVNSGFGVSKMEASGNPRAGGTTRNCLGWCFSFPPCLQPPKQNSPERCLDWKGRRIQGPGGLRERLAPSCPCRCLPSLPPPWS